MMPAYEARWKPLLVLFRLADRVHCPMERAVPMATTVTVGLGGSGLPVRVPAEIVVVDQGELSDGDAVAI